MAKKKQHDTDWAEAKKRCQLNLEDIRMAKALGFAPRSLIKNIPAKNQHWKAPVKIWIRELYEKRFGASPARPGKKNIPAPPSDPPPWDFQLMSVDEMDFDQFIAMDAYYKSLPSCLVEDESKTPQGADNKIPSSGGGRDDLPF